MKILIISNLYPPIVFGGYEILCKQVVEELERRGHQVEVLTSDFMAENAPDEPHIHRVLKLTTDFPRPGESVGEVDFSLRGQHRVGRKNARAVRQVALEFQPDVVFCWCLNRLGSGVVLEAQKMGIPVHYTINDEHTRQFRFTGEPRTLRQFARSMVERIFSASTFRKAQPLKMTVISSALKKNLLALEAPVRDAEVIYQGVDLRRFSFRPSFRAQDESLRILYVGQLSKVKGVHTLLSAVAGLKVPFLLTVVGSGVPEYERELKSIVKERGLSNRVRFLGKRSREEVAQAYGSHHVLVFSSEWEEPFGLTHLEAMASGCAVVSTTTGGSAELVADGCNALAYPAGNSQRLAERLTEIFEDENRRLALVSGGRKYVEEHHCLKKYVSKLESWLRACS
jgi:glycogen synthase